ncbi:hypothetical protein D3C81_1295820 [compost metagenome]
MGQAGGTIGRSHAQINQAVEVIGATTGQTSTQQLKTADDASEHVVEVVGDTAGELADRFHFLRLAQRFFVVAQLCGALFDLLLKGFQGRLQAPFALTQIDQPVAGFVLSSAAAQCGGNHTDQRRRMKRSLKERHVAQQIAEA